MVREELTDLWDNGADAKCITTNGVIQADGNGVMGAGVAGQAQAVYPHMPASLGRHLKENGNHVGILQEPTVDDPSYYIAFPTKHHWRDDSDLELITQSATELMQLVQEMQWTRVLLPKPGCGLGMLNWEDVKAVLEPILDERVVVISNSV